MAKSYMKIRLDDNKFYSDLPMYYFGYKLGISYSNLDTLIEDISWFMDENPTITDGYTTHNILGMLRINDSFSDTVIKDSGLPAGIMTELDDIGLYSVALNLIRMTDGWGLNSTLFDFYKGVKENTLISEDGINTTPIDWATIRSYSKYIDTVMQLDVEENMLDIEKVGNILREIRNFLIN